MPRHAHIRAAQDLANPIKEPSGPVTADSLAAESFRNHGDYAENRGAEPLGVRGDNSTFNTTDTSAASERAPAPYAEARLPDYEPSVDARDHSNYLPMHPTGYRPGQGPQDKEPQPTSHSGPNKAQPKGANLREDNTLGNSFNSGYNAGSSSNDNPSRQAEWEFESRNSAGVREFSQPVGSTRKTNDLEGYKGLSEEEA